MMTQEKLISTLESLDVDAYEVAADINTEKAIRLVSFDDFLRFVQKHQIDVILYYFRFASAQDLVITDDILEELRIDEDLTKVVKRKIDQYNFRIQNLDYTRPYSLSVYFVYQGFLYYIDEDDYWFKDMGFDMPEIAALNIMEEHLEEINNQKQASLEKRIQGREELRQFLLNDPEFRKCTNKQSRRVYMTNLFNNNKELSPLFVSKHGVYDIPVFTFIENVWREYKQNLTR